MQYGGSAVEEQGVLPITILSLLHPQQIARLYLVPPYVKIHPATAETHPAPLFIRCVTSKGQKSSRMMIHSFIGLHRELKT
jgi:hypothetical protein